MTWPPVPSAGDVSYTSVWCRVVRARSTGRIMATIWPFYVLRSYLSLDADVSHYSIYAYIHTYNI